MFGLLPILVVFGWLALPVAGTGAEPWVTVDSMRSERNAHLSNLQLVALDADTLIATYEYVGHYGSNLGTFVARSADRGATWQRLARLLEPRSASLFLDQGALWLLGIDGDNRGDLGRVLVRKSMDQGSTWSGRDGAERTLLRGDDLLDGGSTATVCAGGRVWRTFSNPWIVACTRINSGLLVASAPLGADLLDPGNWRWSSEIPLDCCGAKPWTRRTLVADGSALPRVVLCDSSGASTAILEIRNEGWSVRKEDESPLTLPMAAQGVGFVRAGTDERVWALGSDTTRTPVEGQQPPRATRWSFSARVPSRAGGTASSWRMGGARRCPSRPWARWSTARTCSRSPRWNGATRRAARRSCS
jgi:hypothetical protein